jgi:hypothetical protein
MQIMIPRSSQPSRRRFFGAALRLARWPDLRALACLCDFVEFRFFDLVEFNPARLQTPL